MRSGSDCSLRRHRRRVAVSASKGFTLIELMLTVLLATLVGATFFETMIYQQAAFLRQLENSEALQNGRASLNLITRYIRSSGWGLASSHVIQGMTRVGQCFANASPGLVSGSCDNIDGGSDRLRVVYGRQPSFSSGEKHLSNPGPFLSRVHVGETTDPGALAANAFALISGDCVNPAASNLTNPADNNPDQATDLLRVTAALGPASGFLQSYSYEVIWGPGANLFSCVGGYQNFDFGLATVADFFIDRVTDPNEPTLKMRLDPLADASTALVVAHDIDDLQVQYGLDLSTPPDQSVDTWCNDPRRSLEGGAGDCETGFPTYQNYARIVAVRVAVVPRTRRLRPERVTPVPESIQIFNHQITGTGDGYARWALRATVALRNNQL